MQCLLLPVGGLMEETLLVCVIGLEQTTDVVLLVGGWRSFIRNVNDLLSSRHRIPSVTSVFLGCLGFVSWDILGISPQQKFASTVNIFLLKLLRFPVSPASISVLWCACPISILLGYLRTCTIILTLSHYLEELHVHLSLLSSYSELWMSFVWIWRENSVHCRVQACWWLVHKYA